MMEQAKPNKILVTLAEVAAMTGLAERTIYRMMARDQFPKPVRVPGFRGHRWLLKSINRWCERLEVATEAGCE